MKHIYIYFNKTIINIFYSYYMYLKIRKIKKKLEIYIRNFNYYCCQKLLKI